MAIEDFNQRALRGLERAQQASGARSAEAFAGRLAVRVGGSPDGSTYRRWIRAENVIPAWALIAAADECELSPDALLNWEGSAVNEAELLGLPKRMEAQEAELRALREEVAELRQQSERDARREARDAWARQSTASPPSQPPPTTPRTDRPLRP